MSLNFIYVCFRASIWEQSGFFTESNSDEDLAGWFHIVLNYSTSSSRSPRLRAYVDGKEWLKDSTPERQYIAPGDGRIVLGRAYSTVDDFYTSMTVDEVWFFNEWLDVNDIKQLSTFIVDDSVDIYGRK